MIAVVSALSFAALGGAARADDPLAMWTAQADAARASQPFWAGPLVTSTPLLEQRLRFDALFQQGSDGQRGLVLDDGKGVQVIAGPTTELLFGLPPYVQRSGVGAALPVAGFADEPLLRVKERLFSADAARGDYVVSVSLGLQMPSGAAALTNDAWLLTPTLGFGKGWGAFVVQGSAGLLVPMGAGAERFGVRGAVNLALQYHAARYVWPELEANWQGANGGSRAGESLLYLTAGVMLSRFPLSERTGMSVGAGYQAAVSPHPRLGPLTPPYERAWILTSRLSF